MFWRYIKEIGLKKIIKKSLGNHQPAPSAGKVVTVGVLLDEGHFTKKTALVNDLIKNGIKKENIETLSYTSKAGKKEHTDCCYFAYKDVSATGNFTKEDAAVFIHKPFDLLISFYDYAENPLALATMKSKAVFKVGLGTVDNRMNHLIINTSTAKHTEFINELFKYLKTLNKL